LVRRVLLHLDIVEKDYFGLQFMDQKQVPHWLDPTKKVKKQVKIGPPYTIHFRIKFYAPEPDVLHEELTRYQFFCQIKQDIQRGKLRPTLKQTIDLGAYAVQSELGDFDNTIHCGNYISEFRFLPDQTEEIERAIEKKHRLLAGMNPAECETNYLQIAKNLEFYGMDKHPVMGEDGKEYSIGLTPHGIAVLRADSRLAFHYWKNITNITFKQQRFIMCARTKETEAEEYRYVLSSPQASKHLWKCAIEYHTFFRLIKPTQPPEDKGSLLKMGSRFRYSGRTLAQASKDDGVNARKSMMFKRTRSERFAARSTIGYIRIGSNVWAKAINGDYYRGQVTALSDKVYIKFENGDTIAHDRNDTDALVYDMDPNPNEIKIGTKVIAHWSGLSAYLPGTVTKIESNKYHVLYEDGDRGTNRVEQMRILKPPMFFGPGSGRSKIQKNLSMKATSLIGSTGSAESERPRVQVRADVNRGSRPVAKSPSGDDDVFHRRSHSNSPSTTRSASSHSRHRPSGDDGRGHQSGKWEARLSNSEASRSASADSRNRQNTNYNRNGSSRSSGSSHHKHPAPRGPQPDANTPPLNARHVKNPKTGQGYQITDL